MRIDEKLIKCSCLFVCLCVVSKIERVVINRYDALDCFGKGIYQIWLSVIRHRPVKKNSRAFVNDDNCKVESISDFSFSDELKPCSQSLMHRRGIRFIFAPTSRETSDDGIYKSSVSANQRGSHHIRSSNIHSHNWSTIMRRGTIRISS